MQEHVSTLDEDRPDSQNQPVYLKRKKKNKLIIIVGLVFLVVIVGIYVFFFKKPGTDKSAAPTPTPITTPKIEEFLTPTPTIEEMNKSQIEIQILNGTGIAKEASFLQEKLKALGYSQITISNAQEQNYESTEVSFSSSVSEMVQDEIETELKDTYQKVTKKTSASQSADVVIITGLRPGQSLPTPTPTAKPTPTPTQTGSLTPTPSSTPTPSPTPTP